MNMQRKRCWRVFGSGIRCVGKVRDGMQLRLDPNPGWRRVAVVGMLLFAEAVLINLLTVLQAGRWPTGVEVATFITVGFIQLVTYWLGFLRKEETA